MDKRLKEIKERFKETTYGHWKVYENEEGTCIGSDKDHPQLKSPAPVVTMGYSKDGKKIYISKENAAFIAHSKADMDYLIKKVETLEQHKQTGIDEVLRVTRQRQKQEVIELVTKYYDQVPLTEAEAQDLYDHVDSIRHHVAERYNVETY